MTDVMTEAVVPESPVPSWAEPIPGPQPTIATVAGNGKGEYSGDGCCATTTALREPVGVAVDAAGNVYIADKDNHRVRMLEIATGYISTVAGNGQPGATGDGGDATLARLNAPWDVAVDPQGNIFIADFNNHKVRRVDAVTRVITTYAGNGSAGSIGDGGPAVAARLYYPIGVDVEPGGNVYIADHYNNKIRRVNPRGNISTFAGDGRATFAGDGQLAPLASLNYPSGVSVGPDGNVYIADTNNHRVRMVTLKSNTDEYGVISTVAGTNGSGSEGDAGPADKAKLNYPRRVALTVTGDYYIADNGNHKVRRVTVDASWDPVKTVIHTVAGNGNAPWGGDGTPANATTLYNPEGVCVDPQGNVYVADRYNHRVRKITGTSSPTQFAAEPGGAVDLVVNGDKGNPGVVVWNTGGGTVPPQTVRVSLPSEPVLKFMPEGVPSRFVLSLWNAEHGLKLFYADENPATNPSPGSLTFRNVDPMIETEGARTALWVSVAAISRPNPYRVVNCVFDIAGLKVMSGEISISN
ncbi:NHL repeat-containing protein [Streptomyces lavendulae]|uniref:NHL repeat-containing protein n=1 Tax=Streptomyces lavendulae TaxID=1914 RepID=UPI0036B1A37D